MKMRRNHRQTERRPFTLVELVAAMMVMIFVAMIIATASMTFYKAWERSARVSDRLKVRQSIDRVMDVCVRNMIPFPWRDEEDKIRVVFQGLQDEMFFTARRRAAEGDNSAYLFIRLKLNADQQLVAEYHTLPRFPWMEEGQYEMNTEVLAENVVSISFLYASLTEDEIEWNEEWEDYDPEETQDDTTDILQIPLAVQLTVEWKDGTKEVWLRRTAAASKHSRFGGGTGLPVTESAAASRGSYNGGGNNRGGGGGGGGGNRGGYSGGGGNNRGGGNSGGNTGRGRNSGGGGGNRGGGNRGGGR